MSQRNRITTAAFVGVTAAVLTLVLPVEAQVPAQVPAQAPASAPEGVRSAACLALASEASSLKSACCA